ncbi:hypothetical protein SAMN05421739_101549 [Pontibacter chinhatensis]|uniref:Uncharacterized protein n=1 Tax=Pontibacter chinhatensis TaxID=1436961 RepID=A0A1I2N789_9BACT|nr:hypothetical protein SAMN05421739_101549 [Pontibacter chinhatensis]
MLKYFTTNIIVIPGMIEHYADLYSFKQFLINTIPTLARVKPRILNQLFLNTAIYRA